MDNGFNRASPFNNHMLDCPEPAKLPCSVCDGTGTKRMTEEEFFDYLDDQDLDRLGITWLKNAVDYYIEHDGIVCPECGG